MTRDKVSVGSSSRGGGAWLGSAAEETERGCGSGNGAAMRCNQPELG